MSAKIDNAFLKEIFPPERTDQFFEVHFGGAEEGAYDIVLTVRNETEDHVEMAYELHQRPGKCLVCSLTYGLSTVFRKHPVIDAAGTAAKVAEKMGWDNFEWSIGATQEESSALHWIPFQVKKK